MNKHGRRGFLKQLFVGGAVVASGKAIVGTPEQMKSVSTKPYEGIYRGSMIYRAATLDERKRIYE